MRKIIFLVLLLINLAAFGQEPPYNLMKSNYKFRGIRIDTLMMMPSFPDTATANSIGLGSITGCHIRVDSVIYTRYANRWYKQAGSISNLQSVTNIGNTTSNNIQFVEDADLLLDTFSGIILANGSRLQEGYIDAGYGGNHGIAQVCGLGYELKWEGGRLFVMNNSGNGIREARYMFSDIPDNSKDYTKGYYVGSRWVLDNGDTYVCTDNSLNAAVWVLQPNAFDSTSLSNRIDAKPNLNPTADYIPFNNGSNFSDSYLFNDTANGILKSVYGGIDKGLYLNFNADQYDFGNASLNQFGNTNFLRFNQDGDYVLSTYNQGTNVIMQDRVDNSNREFKRSIQDIGQNLNSINSTNIYGTIITSAGPSIRSDFSVINNRIISETKYIGLKATDSITATGIRNQSGDSVVNISNTGKLGKISIAGKLNASDTASLSLRINNKVDSVKRTGDFVYYYKNGIAYFGFKDSVGAGRNGRFGNDTATIVMAKVHNASGVQLTNGKVVYLDGSGNSSDVPAVKLANNKADSTSANTFGFVTGTIAINDTGWIILSGKIEKLNTAAFSNGDIIYLDSISGGWTKSKPVAPYHLVYLGVVVKANAGNGAIYVKCQNGYELSEIHDVRLNGVVNNQVLAYSDTQKLWKNRNIYSIVDTTNTIATKHRVDTMRTNITTALNTKLNISDTASMLSTYQRSITAVKYSDTASMLTQYLRRQDSSIYQTKYRSDTMRVNIYATLNGKLNTSDSSIYQTKFRTDTMRTNIWNQFAQEVNLADSNTIYSTKFRVDTMRTNIYTALNGKQNTLTNPVTGTGTSGSLTKFNGTSSVTNAVVDVDYLQQDMSMVAMQAMGSSIKGYCIGNPFPAASLVPNSMTDQRLNLTAIWIPKAATITGVRWYQYANGSYTANNYNGVGLYSASSGTLTLVASSTNDANIWSQGANAWQSKAFSSTYSAAAGLYYVGALYCASAATTNPQLGSFGSSAASAANQNVFDFTNNNRLFCSFPSITSLPSSQSLSGNNTNVNKYVFYLY